MPKVPVQYLRSEKTFINPYNFVPIDFSKKEKPDDDSKDIIGWLDCSLITKTPISIPDTTDKYEDERIKEHWHFPFMKKKDSNEYIIPGSSLKGVVRNVFETITDSCFSTADPSMHFTSRITSPAKAGILERNSETGGIYLYSAERYMLKTRSGKAPGDANQDKKDIWNNTKCPVYCIDYQNDRPYITVNNIKKNTGDIIKFNILKDQRGNYIQYINRRGIKCAKVAKEIIPSGEKSGYIVLGESFSQKHHDSIFVKGNIVLGLEPNDKKKINNALLGMIDVLKVYQDPAINKKMGGGRYSHHGYKYLYDIFKVDVEDNSVRMKRDVVCVWYYQDGSNLYIQPAQIGRKAFYKTYGDLINKKTPCNNRDDLCPGCSLFGMVGKSEALGARIRFTDAVCKDNLIRLKEVTLAELGSPRTSYMPFYSDARIEKYSRDGNIAEPSYDMQNIGIRGRKYYWHSNNFNQLNNNIYKTKRNATVEIMPKDKEFKFLIYLDGITQKELNSLVWALNMGDNDNNLCHKIGHGKPIGLGSVKIKVNQAMQRIYLDNEYTIKPLEIAPPKIEDNKTNRLLKIICDFDRAKNVNYPYVYARQDLKEILRDNKDLNAIANHQWFTKNKKEKDSVQILPDIDKEQKLKIYEAEIGNRN